MKWNIIANLAGGTANALLILLITPVQIAILGSESYGLISLIATLQVVVGALDFGLAATVTRAVASSTGIKDFATETLVNSAATVYWGMSLAVGIIMYASADLIVGNWIRSIGISRDYLVHGVQLIGIYLAIRLPVAFYAGVISGAQKMLMLNLIKTGSLTLRLLGGTALIIIYPDLMAFLAWFVVTAILELLICSYYAFATFPPLRLWPGFNIAALRRSLGFSGTMYALALLAMLLTQVDKLAISKILNLEALGHYSVAYNLALGLSLIQIAVNNAAMPAYARSYSVDQAGLLLNYKNISKVLSLMLSAPSVALIIFGKDILTLWVGSDIAATSALSLNLLAAALLLNGLASNSYVLAVSMGQPGMFLSVNLIVAVPYVLMLPYAVEQQGIAGAALAFLVLNVIYVLTAVPWAHSRLRIGTFKDWLFHDVGPFIVLAVVCFTASYALSLLFYGIPDWQRIAIGLLSGGSLYGWISLRYISPDIGHLAWNMLQGRRP